MQRHLQNYRIRKLWPIETETFRRHLLRLDPETRQFRFGTPVNDNFLNAYAETAFRIGTVVYGAFIGPDMYASAELRSLHAVGDEMAEAAFVVETAHRHHGLGSVLMDRIITAAQKPRDPPAAHDLRAREPADAEARREVRRAFQDRPWRGPGRDRHRPADGPLDPRRGDARHQ